MKIKIKNLNKLINLLTGREIDFFLYLVKRQNEFGQVREVYYRDVMLALNMPKSTFYVVLNELETKGFIFIDWSSNSNKYHIVINDNMFLSQKDYKEGYVNINLDYILSSSFISLNINLKKFLLRLLSLQVEKKVVRLTYDTLKKYKVQYLIDELKKLFNIIIDNNIYKFKLKKHLKKKSHNVYFERFKHLLISYCESYKVNYTYQELIDSVKVVVNNKTNIYVLHKALDAVRKKGMLQPKLINYIFSC